MTVIIIIIYNNNAGGNIDSIENDKQWKFDITEFNNSLAGTQYGETEAAIDNNKNDGFLFDHSFDRDWKIFCDFPNFI